WTPMGTVMRGRRLASGIVGTPEVGMAKVMVGAASTLAVVMASRSESVPESAVVLTTKVVDCAGKRSPNTIAAVASAAIGRRTVGPRAGFVPQATSTRLPYRSSPLHMGSRGDRWFRTEANTVAGIRRCTRLAVVARSPGGGRRAGAHRPCGAHRNGYRAWVPTLSGPSPSEPASAP